ncbi:hypothetical protein [Cyanobium sp. NIES-981]|uniref:hypothetical protein n=1 Tax=Cyanobium sp. NIES-981 TaxID=1851505 RepID=UPI0007DD30C8|nr:hypothetical protein [Cyanobium sp. NIES-981]SBO44050.1 conserved protein of unknown function [Cyanobium sp. NIES-981]
MTATPESIQQRYATVERLYSERQWPQVEALCESLLIDLPDSPADPLRQRVILLLGHTRLYGMGDVESARSYYRALLRTEADNTLRQIADQGLHQCDLAEHQPGSAGRAGSPVAMQPPETAIGTGDPFPFSAAAATESTAVTAAAPWLDSVDVVEEPEQIEVALADPQRREEIEVRELEALPAAPAAISAKLAGFSPKELEEFSRGLLGVVLG